MTALNARWKSEWRADGAKTFDIEEPQFLVRMRWSIMPTGWA